MNRNGIASAIRVTLAAGLAGLAGGCIAAPAAALGLAGNVADIGGAAFTAGTEVFTGGKLESVEFSKFEQAQAAVRSMLNDLRLKQYDQKLTKRMAVYDLKDDAGEKIRITLLRRTSAICQIQIDVGYFGSEAYARLLLKSVRARLPLMAGRAATQPAQPVDLFAPQNYTGFSRDNLDR